MKDLEFTNEEKSRMGYIDNVEDLKFQRDLITQNKNFRSCKIHFGSNNSQ